jgi:hypothetical protein
MTMQGRHPRNLAIQDGYDAANRVIESEPTLLRIRDRALERRHTSMRSDARHDPGRSGPLLRLTLVRQSSHPPADANHYEPTYEETEPLPRSCRVR